MENNMKDYYSGSTILQPLSDISGIAVDRLNFLICQIAALFISIFMRKFLHPSKTSSTVRHVFSFATGLSLSYFCFGNEIGHLLLVSTSCYLIMKYQSEKKMQKTVLMISMGYLATIHLIRLIYYYGSYNLDITGPLMVLVQRVSGLAFSLHDGLACDFDNLSDFRKKYIIKKRPSVVEFYGYLFQFQSVLAGPNILFKHYIQFIDGTNFKNVNFPNASNGINAEEPSPVKFVIQKLFLCVICMAIYLSLAHHYDIKIAKSHEFLYNWSLLNQSIFLIISTTLTRFMYYHAWILADAVCNASGLGFSGYDEHGNAKWDITQNIDILGFEFSDNMRNAIACWNTGTNLWLRFLVYERLTKYNKTLFTFLLSAVWHGFYPGYYLCFITAALLVLAARNVRKYVRPYFLGHTLLKRIYDVLTFSATRISIAYFTFPFIIYEFWPVLIIYKNMYFIIHIGSLFAVFLLPIIVKRLPKLSSSN